MTLQEFNELLQLQKYDKEARAKLYMRCVELIKRRLFLRGVTKDVKSHAYSILCKFVKGMPENVFSAYKYLGRCVDNYLYDLKKKTRKTVQLNYDIAYEQYFEHIEQEDTFKTVLYHLKDELNAKIVYLHCVEGVKENEIAEILGIDLSYDAIRQRICRTKNILREKMKPDVTKDDF